MELWALDIAPLLRSRMEETGIVTLKEVTSLDVSDLQRGWLAVEVPPQTPLTDSPPP